MNTSKVTTAEGLWRSLSTAPFSVNKNRMAHIISLVTQFIGNYRHLKRNIKALLKSRGVGHILQTTQVNDNQKLTSLFMEGESTDLHNVKADLVSNLMSIFPGICMKDWQEMASESPLFDSHIAPTPGSLSRDSSGFVEELQEPSADQTLTVKQKWKDYFDSGFIQIVTAIQNGRLVAYEIQSSLESINHKFVLITYKSNTVNLNIGGCIGWSQLLKVIRECKELDIQSDIIKVYSLHGMKKVCEKDLLGLKAEGQYYVETEDDLVQKLSTMDEFFQRLRMEQLMSDVQVKKANECFSLQGITFKQLMATGDLALTDEKLKDYGITQGGLRTAILSVIRSNQ